MLGLGAIFERWDEEAEAASETVAVKPPPSSPKIATHTPVRRVLNHLDHFTPPQKNRHYFIYKEGTPAEFFINLHFKPETDVEYFDLAVSLRDNLSMGWGPRLTDEEMAILEEEDEFYSEFFTNPYTHVFSLRHKFYINKLKPLIDIYLAEKKAVEAQEDLHQEQKKELIEGYFSRFQKGEKAVFDEETKIIEAEVRYFQSIMPRLDKAKDVFEEFSRVEKLSKQAHQKQLQQFIDNLILDAAIAGLPDAIRDVKCRLHRFNNKDGIRIWLPKQFTTRSELEMLAMDLLAKPEGNYYRIEKPELAEQLSEILMKLAANLTDAPPPTSITQAEITELDRLWNHRSPTFYDSMHFWAKANGKVNMANNEAKTTDEAPKEIDPLSIAKQLLI